MRKLEDLKPRLLNNIVDKFYIFFGEDVGIRKHYIDRISTYFDKKIVADTFESVQNEIISNSFLDTKTLYIIYNSDTFMNLRDTQINTFINRINKLYCCILVYDDLDFKNKKLFKNFEDYCTEFSKVNDNIAKEFVEDELQNLTEEEEEEIAYNCDNLYSNVLQEADKIKEYQKATNVSQQEAFEALTATNQLLYKPDPFSSYIFMNNILTNNKNGILECCNSVKGNECYDLFFASLNSMFNDFIIAGLCKQYGKYKGSSTAYSCKLPWRRTKEIRELNLKDDYKYYYDCADRITEVDKLIKRGQLQMENIVDYFITNIL